MEFLLQFSAVLAAVGGIWISWFTYLNGKRMEVFQMYVDKFDRVITSEDISWWSHLIDTGNLPEDASDYHEAKMLQYLNLVWEEYYLYKQGMISSKLWNIWEPGIVEVIKTDFAQNVFKKYNKGFGPSFSSWVKSV
ncbi:MAG: hypothetical protein OIF57_08675 [Marinobacterium sp.]|nr:hypothetical protein [Marinobacterium sp.]